MFGKYFGLSDVGDSFPYSVLCGLYFFLVKYHFFIPVVFMLAWFLLFGVNREGASAAASIVSCRKVGNGRWRLLLFRERAAGTGSMHHYCMHSNCSLLVSDPLGREGRLTLLQSTAHTVD